MLLNLEAVKTVPELEKFTEQQLTAKIKALEAAIREHTHNNFQKRNMRVSAAIAGGVILCSAPFFRVNDSVQVSQSRYNDGVYTITSVDGGAIAVDEELFDEAAVLLTRVIYPADVQEGALNILKWEVANRQKVGIKSESLSRKSTTYFDQDKNNQLIGYPVALVGFLAPHMKARF